MYFRHIWYDDIKGDDPQETKGLSIEGKTYQEYGIYHWTSTLVRVHEEERDTFEHQAWGVATTDKADDDENDTVILAESGSERSSAYYPLGKPRVDKFETTQSMGARLVRDAGQPQSEE